MTKVFNVKHDSVYVFFNENIVHSLKIPNEKVPDKIYLQITDRFGHSSSHDSRLISPYNLMHDELLVLPGSKLSKHSVLKVELIDVASNSNTLLKYSYQYEIKKYDDAVQKAILRSFNVSTFNN